MYGVSITRKNKGWHITGKACEYVLIDYFDEEDFDVLSDLLSKLSSDKDVYVSATNTKGINHHFILHQVVDQRQLLTHKIALSEVSQSSLNQNIFHNRIVCVDIYAPGTKMCWDEYCRMKITNRKRAISNGSLYANICITEESRIEILCKTEDLCIREFISRLDGRGYKLRKKYKILDIFRKS